MASMLTDKDILSSGLLAVKHMTQMYNDVASQTADPQLVKEICDLIGEEHNMRIRLYQTMQQRGWYNPQLIDQPQLQQTQQTVAQTLQQLQQIQPGMGQAMSSPQIMYQQQPIGQFQQATNWQQQHGYQPQTGAAYQYSRQPQ